MKKSTRIIAMTICILMAISMLPISAFASTIPSFNETTPADVVVSAPDEHSYAEGAATFTPETDGFYRFWYTSPSEVESATVWQGVPDYDERQWVADDMMTPGEMRVYLTAGEVYTVEFMSRETETFVIALYVDKCPEIVSVEIVDYPYMMDYLDTELENVDLHGLRVKAIFSDGNEQIFSLDSVGMPGEIYALEYDIDTDLDSETVGTVTVTVGGVSTSFKLNVTPNPVQKIEYAGYITADGKLVNAPVSVIEKTFYNEYYDEETEETYGEYDYDYILYSENAQIKITYTDGSTATCNWYDDLLWEYDRETECDTTVWKAGSTYNVTFIYAGKECQIPVKVVASNVKSITINKQPSYQIKFMDLNEGGNYTYEGEQVMEMYDIDKYISDLKFTVNYKDGTKKTYYGSDIDTWNEKLDGKYCHLSYYFEANKVGPHPVKMYFDGGVASFNLNIVKSGVKSVKLLQNPKVTTFSEIFTPSFIGAKIEVAYENGSKKIVEVTENNIVLAYDKLAVKDTDGKIIAWFDYEHDWETDKYVFTLNACDKSVTFDCMTYQEEEEYGSLTVSNFNTDYKDVKVTAKRDTDGKTVTVSLDKYIEGYGYGFGGFEGEFRIFNVLTDKGIVNIFFEVYSINEVPMYYYVGGFGAYEEVEIKQDLKLKSIAIGKKSDIIRYEKGEKFDPAGIEVILNYANGVQGRTYYDYNFIYEEMEMPKVEVSAVDTNSIGTKTVTVKYEGFTTTFTVEVADGFKDVKKGEWYEQYVEYAAKYGLLQGTGKGNFSPDTHLTRAQFVQILANIEGIDTTGSDIASGYKDVPSKQWYTVAVKWASDNGIVAGFGNGLFRPDDKITREQMCVMLRNYVENYLGAEFDKAEAKASFKDDAKISSWAKDAVYKCQMADIVNGKGNDNFAPQDVALRSEGATLFSRFHQGTPYHY